MLKCGGFFCTKRQKTYPKPALSFKQQARRLLDRGLIAAGEDVIASCLKAVNYYRLSAYWYPFKVTDPVSGVESFAPNTSFETIWRRYSFDRELRLLVMDALERVEVSILRTLMVEQFALKYGPFGYTNIKNFSPEFLHSDHSRLLQEIQDAVSRSKEEFISRFRGKYTNETYLPLWIVVEVMTYGQLFTLFRNLNRAEQQTLSKQFGLYPPVLESWLHTLNFIRNACAHHARLWNRELPIRPFIPRARHRPEWHTPYHFDNRRMFTVLTLLRYLLRHIDPKSDWKNKLETLLQAYPEIPLTGMGFPANWKDNAIWK